MNDLFVLDLCCVEVGQALALCPNPNPQWLWLVFTYFLPLKCAYHRLWSHHLGVTASILNSQYEKGKKLVENDCLYPLKWPHHAVTACNMAPQWGGGDPSVLDANYPPQVTLDRRPLGGGGGGGWGALERGGGFREGRWGGSRRGLTLG